MHDHCVGAGLVTAMKFDEVKVSLGKRDDGKPGKYVSNEHRLVCSLGCRSYTRSFESSAREMLATVGEAIGASGA